jgi:predicted phage tail component-like protein|nr:MAG TPA: tail protein [Caudoviricetes sp.]
MIKTVSVVNQFGDEISTNFVGAYEAPYVITKIEGHGPVGADINLTQFATNDGAMFNSARVGERTMTLTLAVVAQPGKTIEHARRWIYKTYSVKNRVEMAFVTDTGTYIMTGYVEKCEPDIFEKITKVKITIVCPDPYFYAPAKTVNSISSVKGGFEFPFADNATGITNETLMSIGESGLFWFVNDPNVDATWVKSDKTGLNRYGQDMSRMVEKINPSAGLRYEIDDAWRTTYLSSMIDDMTSSAVNIGVMNELDRDLGGTAYFLYVNKYKNTGEKWPSHALKFGEIQNSAKLEMDYSGSFDNGIVIRSRLYGKLADIPRIRYSDSVNPTLFLEIDMRRVKNKIGEDFEKGDYIEVGTKNGNKYVRIWHKNRWTGCLNSVGTNPYWPRIQQGANTITCLIMGDNVNQYAAEHEVEYDIKHQGI